MFNAIKILGVYYSYDKNLENQENVINLFLIIKKLSRLWRMYNVTIAGKITVFKTFTISKIVLLTIVKIVSNSVNFELDKIKKHFLWENGNPSLSK